jgi:hypothetical protein
MSEAGRSAPHGYSSGIAGEAICDKIIDAFKEAANAFIPPEAARKHFRESRVQFWLGIRELVEAKITRLSHTRAE